MTDPIGSSAPVGREEIRVFFNTSFVADTAARRPAGAVAAR